jgi:hypothetical protein
MAHAEQWVVKYMNDEATLDVASDLVRAWWASRRRAGRGALPARPCLLRAAEACNLNLVARYEWRKRVASQRVSWGEPPAPPGALPARQGNATGSRHDTALRFALT